MSWPIYGSNYVMLYIPVSTVQDFCIPVRPWTRSLNDQASVLGQPFQDKTKYSIGQPFVIYTGNLHCFNSEERNSLWDLWKICKQDGQFIWLPSWRRDYVFSSVAVDNKTVTIEESYHDLYTTSLTSRHVVIFLNGNPTTDTPNYRRLTNLTSTQLVLDTALSGMTGATLIMNLYYVNFFSDTLEFRSHGNTDSKTPLKFIEDQRNTPT